MTPTNGFQKGNKLAGSRKGKPNRLTNDVRQVFHKVYDEMGDDDKSGKDGKPLTGHEAMLKWARDNQTEFYRLYGKMIPQTAELGDDLHEDFVATLVFEEEQAQELVEANVTDVGKEGVKQLSDGADVGEMGTNGDDNTPSPKDDHNLV